MGKRPRDERTVFTFVGPISPERDLMPLNSTSYHFHGAEACGVGARLKQLTIGYSYHK